MARGGRPEGRAEEAAMRDPNLIEDLRRLHPAEFGWIGWLAVAVGAALVLGWWMRRSRKMQPRDAGAAPIPDAWAEALRALERLAARLVPAESRAYGIAATDVLRRFVERRYGLEAPRLTTSEFLLVARGCEAMPGPAREGLERFLAACDWMKFGRAQAEGVELERMHEAAVAFVLAAKPADGGRPLGAGASSAGAGAAGNRIAGEPARRPGS